MGNSKGVRGALAVLVSGLLLATGLALPGRADALATVSVMTSANVTPSFTGNLGTIQITGMSVNPGQSDDLIVSLPGGVTLQPWQGGSIDNYVSVPPDNPDTTVPNAFYAGPHNGGSVVQNAYGSNPEITSQMISFWLTAAPSSSTFSGMGTVDVMLPVASVANAGPGPINATVWDTDGIIPRQSLGSGMVVTNPGLQLAFDTTTLQIPTVGQYYSQSITTNGGGKSPYTFYVSSGQLPPGLALSATDDGQAATLAGIPSVAGSYNFTVTVKDVTVYTASQSYTLVVNAANPTVTPAQPAGNFSDIGNSWARAYIVKLARAGIVSGFADGTFRPEATVTRVQFAKMLLTALNLKPAQDTSVLSKYRDRDGFQAWELPWLAAAVDNHLLSGYPDGTLRPDQEVTRLEAAVMMGRTVNGVAPANLAFADRNTIPAWAANYVQLDLARAKGQDLFGSPPAGFFQPGQALTRAGAAAGIAVYLGL